MSPPSLQDALLLALARVLDGPAGWRCSRGLSRLHREREDDMLSLRFGPLVQSPEDFSFRGSNPRWEWRAESSRGWYWGIHFKSFELLRGTVSMEECRGMEEIAALVQERATFLKGRLAMEVPGWTIRWRHACVRGTRSIDGLLLRFRSDRGRRDDDPDLGWVWRWQVVEGASRVVLASGDHHSEAQLDLVGVASFVSDRAAGVVFRQGFYR